jgi:hypothetical protein
MGRAGGLLIELLVLAMVFGSAQPARAVCTSDTTAADFGSGGTCYVAQTGDGELVLAPTVGAEFSGTALATGWGSFLWDPSGGFTVGSGAVTVDGAIVRTDDNYTPGHSLEFVATFTGQPFQHVGFGNVDDNLPDQTFNSAPWAIFSTKNDGSQVRARVWNGGPTIDQDVGSACGNGTCLGDPHRYRIDWTASDIFFFIDGNEVYHETAQTIGVNMRPAISDAVVGAPALSVDWLRMTPYGSPCQFESRIFDGGNAGAAWTTLTALSSVPGGTGMTIETRTGNVLPIDGTWSGYQALSGATIASPVGQYLQYRVTLSSSLADQTPELDAADVCFDACTPSAEVCNGLDDDCDGQIDDGDPGGNVSCDTGNPGICATGVTHCQGGHLDCVQQNQPVSETCNGLDDDCDGSIDDGDPGGGGSCSTGQQGVCAAGTQHCQSGAIACVQNVASHAELCNGLDDDCNGVIDQTFPDLGMTCTVGVGDCARTGVKVCLANGSGTTCSVTPGTPTTEICDGHDNDCDGLTDEQDPGGGGACSTGQSGVCAAGTQHCQAGHLACVRNTAPSGEICNGLDDDCNGAIDDGDPGGGASCSTGQPGVCAAGTQHCQGGSIACVRNTGPSAETCNGVDDDCNGVIDNGDPGGGASCSTGMPGVCAPGTKHCIAGNVTCQANASSTPEVCNNLDDNCNGQIDEGNPDGGGACSTGEQGVCAAGTLQCQSGALGCVRTTGPGAELCNTGADEDCDGQIDELSDCVLCLPASTVSTSVQTKKTKVRLKTIPATDQLQTQGTFVLPAPGTIAPDTEDVSLRLTDGSGLYYQATIPAGSFRRAGNGRHFTFSDRAGVHGGIRTGKFAIKGDGVTVKYTIKAAHLDEPSFAGSSSTATIQVGSRCFADTQDLCTVSSNGSSALCR